MAKIGRVLTIAIVALTATLGGPTAGAAMAATAYDFSFPSIDGEALDLAQFRGRPILLVNTASFCGFTPQYDALEAVWKKYRERGLIVLGVPSNDFGEQEPGSSAEIKSFCSLNYNVDFPLAEKQKVIGPNAHPLYRWIADRLGEAGAPRWNFHKYLVGTGGKIAGVWPSSVAPMAPEILSAIETELEKSPHNARGR